MTEAEQYCRACGSQLRADTQFCTMCGQPAGAASAPPPEPAPVAAPGPGQPRPGQPRPSQRRPGRRPPWVALLAIGVPVVAGLAVLVVVVAHPFNHPARVVTGLPSSSAANTAASTSAPAPAPSSSLVSPSPSESSSPSPEQAATNLAALLARSAQDRQAIDNAYDDATGCGPNLSRDAQAFQNAADSHRQLLAELAQLPGQSALSQPMLGDLQSAWQASASADDHYATWVQGEEGGCSAGNQSDSSFQAATAPNLRATASKTAFVQLWNPLARNYGLTTYQQDGF